MTTPPDVILGLSPADRAELTRLLVEQVEADRVLTEVIASPATTAGDIRCDVRTGADTSGRWSLHEAVMLSLCAPAGWPMEAEDASFACEQPRPFGSVASARASLREARIEMQAIAVATFIEAIEEGLTASEAADVLVRHKPYVNALRVFTARCDMVPQSPAPASAREVFPRGIMRDRQIAALLDRGIRAESLIYRGVANLESSNGGETTIPANISSEARQRDPLWFLADPMMPSSVMRALLASHRGFAMATVVDGFLRDHRGKSLFVEAAQVWVDEMEIFLRLVASIPGTEVSEEDVPLADRIDIMRELAEQRPMVADLRSMTA